MSSRLFSECAQNELRRRSGPVYTTTLKCPLIRCLVYLINFWRFLVVCEIASYSSSTREIKLRCCCNAKMPARKRFALAYYLPDSSLLALIHNIALSNGYCVSQLSVWVTLVCHNTATGSRSVPITRFLSLFRHHSTKSFCFSLDTVIC
jgi:hypothetical protein